MVEELRSSAERWARLAVDGQGRSTRGNRRANGPGRSGLGAAAARAKGIPGRLAMGGGGVDLGSMGADHGRFPVCGEPSGDRLGHQSDRRGAIAHATRWPRRVGCVPRQRLRPAPAERLQRRGVDATRRDRGRTSPSTWRRSTGSRIHPVMSHSFSAQGNISSIVPLDLLYKMFVEGAVGLVKMNPVNDYLGEYLEAIFAPADRRRFRALRLRRCRGGCPPL